MRSKGEVSRHISGYAAFISAPTIAFARSMIKFNALAAPVKSSIAAGVLARLRALESEPRDDLGALAQRLQTERWKLIYAVGPDMQNVEFATISLTEQWVRATLTLLDTKTLMVAQLAGEAPAAH
jgi:hypothetical protein